MEIFKRLRYTSGSVIMCQVSSPRRPCRLALNSHWCSKIRDPEVNDMSEVGGMSSISEVSSPLQEFSHNSVCISGNQCLDQVMYYSPVHLGSKPTELLINHLCVKPQSILNTNKPVAVDEMKSNPVLQPQTLLFSISFPCVFSACP